MAVPSDPFGTLAAVERPDEPTAAVAHPLGERGVAVSDDWAPTYREPRVAAPQAEAVVWRTGTDAPVDLATPFGTGASLGLEPAVGRTGLAGAGAAWVEEVVKWTLS
ncbi:MAG: hypothetical protein ABEJ26_10285 [Halosimplex sp.]